MGLTSLLMLLVVGINFVVDPFTYYHPPWLEMNISGNHRYANPGLARQYPYRTALVGTSHVMEIRSDDLSKILNEPALNLSISGGLIREQAQLVELILRQKKADTILWEMNYHSLSLGDSLSNAESAYPEFIYSPTVETPFRYLMSFDTLRHSFEAVSRPHEVTINNRNQLTPREFSRERVVAHWEYQVQHWNTDLRDIWAGYRRTEISHVKLLELRLKPIIKKYPEVTFKLFLPPANLLGFLLQKHIGDYEISQRLGYRNAIAELEEEFPNVEIYDFETDWLINNDLNRFRDLYHFDESMLHSVFMQVTEETNQTDKENMLADTQVLEERIERFGREFCSQNPDLCPDTLISVTE